ncbi:hypothetical protein IHN63_00625 [Deinococcus sp. 6YEL10]|uniref:hypothetical protein n=1 Tax=Deinococcus sp. 6YEL10 TaxID=2745870 RepID=UPI001E40901F|nr:hypothetical protein [Deinococcus sp. 6YEL10]MCD0159804.1 hypothetical protein [Deinococcus sp. 6YEL10]
MVKKSEVNKHVSPRLQEYVEQAKPWLTHADISNHTGIHPWTVISMVGKTHTPSRTISHKDTDTIILTYENLKEPTIRDIQQMTELPEPVIRQVLMEFRKPTTDLFDPIRHNGGNLRFMPMALRHELKVLYTQQKRSSRQIAQVIEDTYGVKLSDFGVRKMLLGMGVALRDRRRATLLSVNKLTKEQEQWIATVYKSSDVMSIPLVSASFENQFKFGVSEGTVVRVLDAYNIEIRGSRKATTKRHEKHVQRLRRTG